MSNSIELGDISDGGQGAEEFFKSATLCEKLGIPFTVSWDVENSGRYGKRPRVVLRAAPPTP